MPTTPTPQCLVALTGALLAGAAVVPVGADAGSDHRRHLLADSGAQAWLGPPQDDLAVPSVPVDDLLRGRAAAASGSLPEPDPERPALIVYTSGTTGPPKGAVLSRRAVAAGLDALAQAWDISPDDVVGHGLPLAHVHGLVLGVLGPLRWGCALVHTGRPDPGRYAAAAASGASVLYGVPTLWGRVASDAASARELRSARLLVSGSAALPGSVAEALARLTGRQPVERYGMTETLITLAAPAAAPRRTGWVGPPVAGVQAQVVADDGDPVPADGESLGDLLVRGATMFQGYHGRPTQTAAAWTADGWFRTGDVAAVAPDGWHRIAGRRATDLIASGGYRIGAGEIEACLLEHPSVDQAAVIGVPDGDLGQRVVAYVVAAGVGERELVEHVATRLARYKRPRQVRFVADLPRNELGKVLKSRLPADGG